MAPRKESPKKKASKPKKTMTKSKTTKIKDATKVRKARTEDGMKMSPDKRGVSTHGYNLRGRCTSSVLVVEENCACSEGDRRRLHRLHLHSPQCISPCKRRRRCQSHITVVTVSSEEDEIMSLERTARWVQDIDVEQGGDTEVQGDVPVPWEGQEELQERGRAGGRDNEVELMLVDPSASQPGEVTGMRMETDSAQMHKAASPSQPFEIACAMNLSTDLALDFRPLCVSTPECRPISPRNIELPGPSLIPFGDLPGLPAASVNSEPFRFGDPPGLPTTSLNPAETFCFNLPSVGYSATSINHEASQFFTLPRSSDSEEPPASSGSQFSFTVPRIGDFAEHMASVNQVTSKLSFEFSRIGDSTGQPPTSPETSQNRFDPHRIGDSTRRIPDEGPTQFFFGPSSGPSKRLWKASSSPLGSSGNPISYEFGVSGIRRFEAAISEQESTIKVEDERKRKRSEIQVASSSKSPVPPVVFEPDN